MRPITMQDLRPCDLCGSPVAGKTRDGMNAIDLRRVFVERHLVNARAVRGHVGLSLMLGSEKLAHVMGSQEPATNLMSVVELVICNPCWYDRIETLEPMVARARDLGVVPA
jgi:hypothetical protein